MYEKEEEERAMADNELGDERADTVARERARIETEKFETTRWRWSVVIVIAFMTFAAWAYYGYLNMRSAEPPAQTTGESQPAPSPPPTAGPPPGKMP
jgi:hypothetical protein